MASPATFSRSEFLVGVVGGRALVRPASNPTYARGRADKIPRRFSGRPAGQAHQDRRPVSPQRRLCESAARSDAGAIGGRARGDVALADVVAELQGELPIGTR
jgi:hypothetical protein